MLSECDEKSKFQAVLELAKESLQQHPAERASLQAIVADCELRWKAEVDADLASSIILGSTKLPGPLNQHTAAKNPKDKLENWLKNNDFIYQSTFCSMKKITLG